MLSVHGKSPRVDSTYIRFYTNRISISPYLNRDFLQLNISDEDRVNRLFMPNNPVKTGLEVSLNNSIIRLGYDYGFNFFRDKEKVKTKSFDFNFHSYGRILVYDLFIQKYRGFYEEQGKRENKIVTNFSDLDIQQYGFSTLYVFNNKKFSYQSAYYQSEIQKKSAGSFLAGSGIYLTKIKSESKILYDDMEELNSFQYGINGGYSYNWVFHPKWLVNISTTTGINFGNEKNNITEKNNIQVYPTVFTRFSTSYNKNSWSISFSYVGNVIFPSYSDKKSMNVHSGSLKLMFTKRFHIPAITSFFDKINIL
jgi:hypothetical protein